MSEADNMRQTTFDELRPEDEIVQDNLRLMTDQNLPGNMIDCMEKTESLGGNAGFFGSHPCGGCHFRHSGGAIKYFEDFDYGLSCQHIPPDQHGIFRVALQEYDAKIGDKKFRIVYYSPDLPVIEILHSTGQ